jgi:hypothetical protein
MFSFCIVNDVGSVNYVGKLLRYSNRNTVIKPSQFSQFPRIWERLNEAIVGFLAFIQGLHSLASSTHNKYRKENVGISSETFVWRLDHYKSCNANMGWTKSVHIKFSLFSGR